MLLSILGGIFAGAGSLLGGLSSVFAQSSAQRAQNRALDKQIKAQADENRKTREYNLMLAKQQNAWNIEQWNRENEYNTPTAQMQRFAAAGLNPNLIYGQTNTAPQLSGSLSAGAPASPNDMSPVGQKGSSLAAGMQKLGEAMMSIPLYREQVRSLRLQNEGQEIRNSEESLNLDIKSNFFGIGASDWSDFMQDDEKYNDLTSDKPAPVRKLFDEMRRQHFETLEARERYRDRVISNAIGNSTYQSVIKRIMAEANISEQNARFIFDTYTERVAGTKAHNMMLQKEESFMTTDKYIERTAGALNILINGYNAVYGRKFGITQ